AVAANFASLLGEDLWRKVCSNGNCQALAELARYILRYKGWFHDKMGTLVSWVLLRMHFGSLECRVGRELAKKIPLPWDHQMEAVAHALRVLGIYLCALGGNLSRCQCLADLAHAVAVNKITETLSEFLTNMTQRLGADLRAKA